MGWLFTSFIRSTFPGADLGRYKLGETSPLGKEKKVWLNVEISQLVRYSRITGVSGQEHWFPHFWGAVMELHPQPHTLTVGNKHPISLRTSLMGKRGLQRGSSLGFPGGQERMTWRLLHQSTPAHHLSHFQFGKHLTRAHLSLAVRTPIYKRSAAGKGRRDRRKSCCWGPRSARHRPGSPLQLRGKPLLTRESPFSLQLAATMGGRKSPSPGLPAVRP